MKEKDQGSVKDVGEQAENEEPGPKSGAVDCLEVSRSSFANVVGLMLEQLKARRES